MDRELVVVVDDEPKLLRLVQLNLESAGYRVLTATDAGSGLDLVARHSPDLVILDILLNSDRDGFEVCEQIREFSQVPVIMLTAKAREQDRLRGFEAGADDYITKPFSSAELVARVQAVLRRTAGGDGERDAASLVCGDLKVDYASRRVYIGDGEVSLTPTEYKLLYHLARNAGKIMMHEELLTRVWGIEYRDDVDYLRVYVNHLRNKLEPDRKRPRLIKSKPGFGYWLDPEDCS